MNLSPEVRRFITKEIQRQVQIITAGTAGANTMSTQDINAFMPGAPTLSARPIMQPYGFASRAPNGMIAVTAQQGEHPGNKMTLGHRDKDAPEVDEGESVQYSVAGYRVMVKKKELFIGKGADLEHMVVGETLKAFLIALIQDIILHTHEVTALSAPTGPPLNASDFTDLETENLDNDKILAKDGGRF